MPQMSETEARTSVIGTIGSDFIVAADTALANNVSTYSSGSAKGKGFTIAADTHDAAVSAAKRIEERVSLQRRFGEKRILPLSTTPNNLLAIGAYRTKRT